MNLRSTMATRFHIHHSIHVAMYALQACNNNIINKINPKKSGSNNESNQSSNSSTHTRNSFWPLLHDTKHQRQQDTRCTTVSSVTTDPTQSRQHHGTTYHLSSVFIRERKWTPCCLVGSQNDCCCDLIGIRVWCDIFGHKGLALTNHELRLPMPCPYYRSFSLVETRRMYLSFAWSVSVD